MKSKQLPTPNAVVVTVNLDIESRDARNARGAGLLGRYSYGRYGAREGVWRLLDVLRTNAVSAAFFVSPDDARRHPDLIEAILEGGHEVAAQGQLLTDAEPTGIPQLELLEEARETLTSLTGTPPKGWRCSNGLLTADVLPALAQAGYLYDSSFQDDDQPYVFDAGSGLTLVELPVQDYLTDATFYGHLHTPARVAKVWHEEFEANRAAGAYVHLQLHCRGDIGSGRAVRAKVVSDVLGRMRETASTRFYRPDELALLHANATAPERIPNWPMSATGDPFQP